MSPTVSVARRNLPVYHGVIHKTVTPQSQGARVDYIVQEVRDDELPEGRHVVIVERENGPPVMLINGAPARVWRLMQAWEDNRACTEPSVLLRAV